MENLLRITNIELIIRLVYGLFFHKFFSFSKFFSLYYLSKFLKHILMLFFNRFEELKGD